MRLLRWLWLPALVAVPWLQTRIDERLGTFRATEEVLYVWSGDQWKQLLPGFEDVLADVYWIRAVQYYGGVRLFERYKRYELLEPIVNITVSLDPRFELAYRYGGMFLSEEPPFGAGRPEAGVKLLERGVQELPRAWLLQQALAFNTWHYLGDGQRAAGYALRAAALPGAPPWLEFLAGDFLQKGAQGQRQAARRLWQRMYETNEGPLGENALFWLRYMDAEDQILAWRRALLAYAERRGFWPLTLHEVGAPLPPSDPTGKPYRYDPATATIRVDKSSELWRPALDDLSERPLAGM